MSLVIEFNDWYETQKDTSTWGGESPEHRLPEEMPERFQPFRYGVDEGRDRNVPSEYYVVCQLGDIFIKIDGYYDSWNGTEWGSGYGSDGWYEVEKKTRTETYWGTV